MSYSVIILDTIQAYCNYDLIKCMLTLPDQLNIASYTPVVQKFLMLYSL